MKATAHPHYTGGEAERAQRKIYAKKMGSGVHGGVGWGNLPLARARKFLEKVF